MNFYVGGNAVIELLQFTAKWCGPCRQMHPLVEAFRVSNSGVQVTVIDIDDHPNMAQRFGVRSVPTFVVLRDGKETARRMGTMRLSDLEGMVR